MILHYEPSWELQKNSYIIYVDSYDCECLDLEFVLKFPTTANSIRLFCQFFTRSLVNNSSFLKRRWTPLVKLRQIKKINWASKSILESKKLSRVYCFNFFFAFFEKGGVSFCLRHFTILSIYFVYSFGVCTEAVNECLDDTSLVEAMEQNQIFIVDHSIMDDILDSDGNQIVCPDYHLFAINNYKQKNSIMYEDKKWMSPRRPRGRSCV